MYDGLVAHRSILTVSNLFMATFFLTEQQFMIKSIRSIYNKMLMPTDIRRNVAFSLQKLKMWVLYSFVSFFLFNLHLI